jgi:hypothetical protein
MGKVICRKRDGEREMEK